MKLWRAIRAAALRLLLLVCIVSVLGMAFCLSVLLAVLFSNMLPFDFWPLAIVGMAFLGLALLVPLLKFLEDGGWPDRW